MKSSDIFLPCMNGFTLCIKGENLVVKTKRSEEAFPISNIQSVALKEPKTLSPGSIVFRTAQAATAGINLGLGIGLALGAEKTFFFHKSNLDVAQSLCDYITDHERKTTNKYNSSQGMVVSIIDEIRGLKDLLDEGILTQEEFEAKKKQLLSI